MRAEIICSVTLAAIPTRRGANAGKRRLKGHSTQPTVLTRGKGTHKLDAFLATLSPRQAQQIRASTDSVFWDDVPTYPDF